MAPLPLHSRQWIRLGPRSGERRKQTGQRDKEHRPRQPQIGQGQAGGTQGPSSRRRDPRFRPPSVSKGRAPHSWSGGGSDGFGGTEHDQRGWRDHAQGPPDSRPILRDRCRTVRQQQSAHGGPPASGVRPCPPVTSIPALPSSCRRSISRLRVAGPTWLPARPSKRSPPWMALPSCPSG